VAKDFLVREVLVLESLLARQREELDALLRGHLADGLHQVFCGHDGHPFLSSSSIARCSGLCAFLMNCMKGFLQIGITQCYARTFDSISDQK
jgi:hypothetical protein